MTKDEHTLHDKKAEQEIIDTVNRHGWFVALFNKTEYLPSFAYTIGLHKTFNHPEIISFGLTTGTLHQILNIAGEKVRAGEVITPGKVYDDEFFEGGVAQFIKVDASNIPDYMGYGMWYNEHRPFEVLQLVWTDRNKFFPWQSGYDHDEFKFRQPLLDRVLNFKFFADRNLAVVTSRHHLELNKSITYVLHEEDGDWQFLTSDDVTDSDIRWVALEEIVNRDPSLNTLFNLDEGQYAEKDSQGKWVRGSI
jgi:hypothetical protein